MGSQASTNVWMLPELYVQNVPFLKVPMSLHHKGRKCEMTTRNNSCHSPCVTFSKPSSLTHDCLETNDTHTQIMPCIPSSNWQLQITTHCQKLGKLLVVSVGVIAIVNINQLLHPQHIMLLVQCPFPDRPVLPRNCQHVKIKTECVHKLWKCLQN